MQAVRVLPLVLRALPIVPPIVFFVTSAVRATGFGGVVLMLFLSAVSFGVLVTLNVLTWLRRGRAEDGPTATDLAWIGGTALAWIVSALLPTPWQALVAVVAAVVSVLAVRAGFRSLRRALGDRLDANVQDVPGRSPPPGGPAEGPDAGKVITIRPSSTSSGPTVPGAMPGSTRTTPPSGSSRVPGSNFGDNAAPPAPDWDPTRPVPGAEDGRTPDDGPADR